MNMEVPKKFWEEEAIEPAHKDIKRALEKKAGMKPAKHIVKKAKKVVKKAKKVGKKNLKRFLVHHATIR